MKDEQKRRHKRSSERSKTTRVQSKMTRNALAKDKPIFIAGIFPKWKVCLFINMTLVQ